MKALLLLAGRSERFWPLTEKPLFPILGKTLLEHQVERLQIAGFKDVVLVGGGHNLEATKKVCPKLQCVKQEDLELGMRGALLSALPQFKEAPFAVIGGNDVIDPKGYAALRTAGEKKGCDGALLAQRVARYFPGGYLETDGDRITGISEKPGEGNEPSDLVNIVAHVHQSPRLLLEALQGVDESRDDGYEQALARLFVSHTYHAVPYDGHWHPVKYPWHLIPLLEQLLSQIPQASIDPSADIHPTAVIEGNVVLEEGVKVFAHSTIVGPCYIGRNSIIANNALVRLSSVGENSVVGFCTEVKASVLHSHVWTHMNYIGESVLGRNVALGGGTITGNLRLDESEVCSLVDGERISTGLTKFGNIIGDNCRIGVHVSTNPGIKIGAGSFVNNKVLVSADIPEKSFVTTKGGELSVRENRDAPGMPEERDVYRRAVTRDE